MKNSFLLSGLLAASSLGCLYAQTWKPSDVANAGGYYIYNTQAKKWLSKNNGEELMLTSQGGDLFYFQEKSAGEYYIKLVNSRTGDPSEDYVLGKANSYAGIFDNLTFAEDSPWILTKGTDGSYVFKTPEGEALIGKANKTDVDIQEGAESSESAKWLLVTYEDRLADLQTNASPTNPIDATFLMINPDLHTCSATSPGDAWNMTGGIINVRGTAFEGWNSIFDVYQIVSGAPVGDYKMSVRGFYRNLNPSSDGYEAHVNNTEEINAYMYAADTEQKLLSMYSAKSPGGNYEIWVDGNLFYYPNMPGEAADIFCGGGYQNPEMSFYNGSSEELRIGVKCSKTGSADWTMFSHFSLTFYGKEELDYTAYEQYYSMATHYIGKLGSAGLGSYASLATLMLNGINNTARAADRQTVVDAQTNQLKELIVTALSYYTSNISSDLSLLIDNNGFEECNPFVGSLATSGSANSTDYIEKGWQLVNSSSWTSSAVMKYGDTSSQLNGADLPSVDAAVFGTNGMALTSGWSGKVAYQTTNSVLLPAGNYRLKAKVYNVNSATALTSLLAFIPDGEAITYNAYRSISTSYPSGEWTDDMVDFTLTAPVTGRFQVGAMSSNNGSNNHAKILIDNVEIMFRNEWEQKVDRFMEAYETAKKMHDEAQAIEIAHGQSEEYSWLAAAVNASTSTYTALEEASDKYNQTAFSFTVETLNDYIDGLESGAQTYSQVIEDYRTLANSYTIAKQYGEQEWPYASPTLKGDLQTNISYFENEYVMSNSSALNLSNDFNEQLRAYIESNASIAAEIQSFDFTGYITNPDPTSSNNTNGWTQSNSTGASLGVRSDESFTDSKNTSSYKYFDGGNWGANSWNTRFTQDVALPAGRYLLSVTARASVNMSEYKLIAGDQSKDLECIGNGDGAFSNGWNDAYIEFITDGKAPVTIGVSAQADQIHQWQSFSRFRLYKFANSTVIASEDETWYGLEDIADVELHRSFTPGQWNSLVLPFDVEEEELYEHFGNDVQVAEFEEMTYGGTDEEGVNFVTMTHPAIKANQPVLILISEASLLTPGTEELIKTFAFTDRILKTATNPAVEGEHFNFVGVYNRESNIQPGNWFFSGSSYYKATTNTKPMKTFRAYIEGIDGADLKGVSIDGGVIGDATSINGMRQAEASGKAIYNLQGQKVNKMEKGVYIQNGKKILVR